MKSTISFKISILLITAFALVSFNLQDKWYVFESVSDGYAITFPKQPSEQPQTIESPVGPLQLNIYIYDASQSEEDENLIYMVNCTSYPDSLVNSEKTEMLGLLYRNSIQGAVANVKGKLISEKTLYHEKYEGREIKVELSGGQAIINMRLFLVKNKMFMLQTISEKYKDNNASMKKFMDSFKLLPTKE